MLDVKLVNEIMGEDFSKLHERTLEASKASYDKWCEKAEKHHEEMDKLNRKFIEECWKADRNF